MSKKNVEDKWHLMIQILQSEKKDYIYYNYLRNLVQTEFNNFNFLYASDDVKKKCCENFFYSICSMKLTSGGSCL